MKAIIQETGVDINISRRDKDFLTPLHHAVMSGNIKAVQPIAEVCSRYKLNIDICDKHGLTPYIHARRLGYHDIAELLVNVGKASTFMSDAKSFKNADEWAVEGVRERIKNVRLQMHKQEMSRKMGGQFPKSKQSKTVPTIVVTTSNRKSYVVDLNKSKNFMGHSLREFDDKKAHGLRPREYAADAEAILNASHGVTHPSTLSLLALNNPQRKEPSDQLPKLVIPDSNKEDKNKKFTSKEFNYLMYILSEQSTEAYRKPAKFPGMPRSTISSLNSELQDNISSLAILLGKDEKSGRRSSPRRTASRATRLDRAPSGMSSKKPNTLTLLKKKGRTSFLPTIESRIQNDIESRFF